MRPTIASLCSTKASMPASTAGSFFSTPTLSSSICASTSTPICAAIKIARLILRPSIPGAQDAWRVNVGVLFVNARHPLADCMAACGLAHSRRRQLAVLAHALVDDQKLFQFRRADPLRPATTEKLRCNSRVDARRSAVHRPRLRSDERDPLRTPRSLNERRASITGHYRELADVPRSRDAGRHDRGPHRPGVRGSTCAPANCRPDPDRQALPQAAVRAQGAFFDLAPPIL